ncbi:MAG: sulfatase [Verrucomicrobiota bacterium]
MKKYVITVFISLFTTPLCFAVTPPNIIIIFTDDLGYGDVNSFTATEGYQTPELDGMAAEGLKFTDFHASHCVCSPSRAGLLTGRYPRRAGVPGVYFPRSKDGLNPAEITIAEVLKEQGFATAMIGKWHLGHLPQFLPTEQGFDSFFGIPYSNDMAQDGGMPLARDVKFLEGMTLENFREYQPQKTAAQGGKNNAEGQKLYAKYKNKVPLMRDTEVIEWPVDQSQISRRYTEKAVEFIQNHQAQPFFLYYAHTMPHTPLFASEIFNGKTERGIYGDVIEEIDWSVGEILRTLKELEIDKHTLVVFTSDNGPWLVKGDHGGSAGPLRDGKGTTYEGGQRVPCIFWWPGTITAGSETDFNASNLDLMPTIANLTGARLPDDRMIDGTDISCVLQGEPDQASPAEFFVYARGQAIRVGNWKYRKGKAHGTWFKPGLGQKNKSQDGKDLNPVVEQLFSLEEDLAEQNNLIEKYPEKAEELRQLLESFNSRMKK